MTRAGTLLTFRVAESGAVTLEAATIGLRSLIGSVESSVRGVTIEQMLDSNVLLRFLLDDPEEQATLQRVRAHRVTSPIT